MLSSLLSIASHRPTHECASAEYVLTEPEPTTGIRVAYIPIGRVSDPTVLYIGGTEEEVHDSAVKCDTIAKEFSIRIVCFALPGSNEHTKHDHMITESINRAVCLYMYDTCAATYVWGRSMGASLASYVATERPVDGLILEAPLASVRTWIAQHQPRVASVLKACSVDAYSTLAETSGLNGKHVVLLRLEEDDVLSSDHAASVYAELIKYGAYVTLGSIPGVGHNDRVVSYTPFIPISFFHPHALYPHPEITRV